MALFVSIDLHPNSKGWRNYGLSVGHHRDVRVHIISCLVCVGLRVAGMFFSLSSVGSHQMSSPGKIKLVVLGYLVDGGRRRIALIPGLYSPESSSSSSSSAYLYHRPPPPTHTHTHGRLGGHSIRSALLGLLVFL